MTYYAQRSSTQIDAKKLTKELLYHLLVDELETVQLRVFGTSWLLKK